MEFRRGSRLDSRIGIRRSWRLGLLLLFLTAAARAQIITEFSSGISPSSQSEGITAGPDGNLWFTEQPDRIGRITPQGVVTEFSAGITPGAAPWSITAGPDGNVWFGEQGRTTVGRITRTGVITEFSTGVHAGGILGITAGPDGNVWFTEFIGNVIGRITPSGVVTEFNVGLSASAGPWGITAGPDGNLWFTEYVNPGRIGRITPAGAITEFETGITPGGGIEAITAGPDGNLWFADQNNSLIGRITPTGTVTEFPTGGFPQVRGISAGPDGNVWFTEYNGAKIGRIDPTGAITEFNNGMSVNPKPRGITLGPDGNLWFTEEVGNRIARITTGAAVVVTSITPSSGPASGISGAVVAGGNFAAGANVSVGGTAASGVVVDTATQITMDVPSVAPGAVYPVTVTEPGPTSGVLTDGWFADLLDVPGGLGIHKFVEKLVRHAITAGCNGGNFCPDSSITRAQMAVFLLRSNEGPAYTPPACVAPTFNDVPCASGFAKWVDELAARGVTAGCGGGAYCPDSPATRGQMAVFLIRTREGPSYFPPACVTPAFADVPCASGLAIWIDELAARGITAGCGGGNYCPGTPVTRGQMAVFLVTTFSLS